jgi:mannose-6-phosphate isomerase-like protein (cupin superfamily)
MNDVVQRNAYPTPVDQAEVRAGWQAEGFSFGVFRDGPGQEWNGFVHGEDEYVAVAEGRLRISVGDATVEAGPGDLVRIPAGVVHSLKTLSAGGSVWLYGYGFWGGDNG